MGGNDDKQLKRPSITDTSDKMEKRRVSFPAAAEEERYEEEAGEGKEEEEKETISQDDDHDDVEDVEKEVELKRSSITEIDNSNVGDVKSSALRSTGQRKDTVEDKGNIPVKYQAY